MTLTSVMDRIGEIRQQLQLLGVPTATGTTDSSAIFAQTLHDASTGTTGQQVVDAAKKYLGVPYVWGGTDPAKGLDCSGLVQVVYKEFGYDLPRLAGDQVLAGRKVNSLAEARPGDLLGFGGHPMKHVGIYIGDGKMIHAPKPGRTVEISSVYEKPTAIGRILPEAPGATGSTTGSKRVANVFAPAHIGSLNGVPYADLFQTAGKKYGVPPELLAAVAKAESNFNPKAVSSAGAQGMMQLMPGTAKSLGVTDSFDPTQAVNGAAKMLRDLLDRFGETRIAVAAYNAGPGAVAKYNGIPPYRETQNYVQTVMRELARYS